ncbi:lipopolysaccharide biosynthesis protein [Acinetobacter sp. YH16058]|uniref:lipopolysaccharide biosynthesis protein n=1 Tax=Acinetobacter sp. YH16058 TaxID=2601196 RepID=UPI0015D3E124|nr:oligosaccharide flippase family protein [Acinetobacter sp. YH16058]
MKSLLVKINNKLNAQGGFLKAVSVLVGGAAFAQVIGLICLPILTRLYTPEDYSILGVYVAIVAILSVVTCLRFDIAIPIPESTTEGRAVLYLALISNIVFTLLLFLMLVLTYPYLIQFELVKKISFWIWLIPLGVSLTGFYSALQYWATRNKRFKVIAKTRVTQAVFSNASSMGLGFSSLGFSGLIVGQLLSYFGGLFRLTSDTLRDKNKYKEINLKKTFIKYQNFPKYSTLEGLANTSAIQLPLIIIAIYVAGPEVGYLMLAMKVLGIPMGLIGSAISQVYLSNAGEFYKKEKLYSYTKNIVNRIFKIVFFPFVALMLLSPYIFEWVFGKSWSDLGYYIMGMIPWYFMQILSSPVSMSLHVLNKQKIALFLQILGFFIRVIVLSIVVLHDNSIAVYYYILSGFIFYILYFMVIMYVVKSDEIKCMH